MSANKRIPTQPSSAQAKANRLAAIRQALGQSSASAGSSQNVPGTLPPPIPAPNFHSPNRESAVQTDKWEESDEEFVDEHNHGSRNGMVTPPASMDKGKGVEVNPYANVNGQTNAGPTSPMVCMCSIRVQS